MSNKKQKGKKYRLLRRFLRFLTGILIFLVLLLLFIRSPWGQNIIVDKVTNYVSNKTNTKVEIDHLFITFDGNLQVDGLFLEDKKGDTLIYSKSLEANLPIWGIISGKSIDIDDVSWTGLKANIVRKDTIDGFNFQFLVDAFATQNTQNQSVDSLSTSPKISIGAIELQDVDVVYNDAVLGIESSYKVANLEGSFKTTDLENMIFIADDLSIKNSDIKYIQKPPFFTSDEEVPLPILGAETISIEKTNFYYEDVTNQLITDFSFNKLVVENPDINLSENQFSIERFFLKNSDVLVKTSTKEISNSTTNNSNFIWPDVKVNIESLDLENNKVNYLVNNTEIEKNRFNPNAISINNLYVKTSKLFYEKENAEVILDAFRFKESSGFELNQLNFSANLTDENFSLNGLNLRTKSNRIAGNFNASFNSISQLINAPEKVQVQANLPTIQLQLNELFDFQPSLKNNVYLNELSKKMISGRLFANGNLANITIRDSDINWGESTKIDLNGALKNATDVNALAIEFPNIQINTIRKDVLKFVNEDDLGIQLPEEMVLAGSVNGTLTNISTDLKLQSSQGDIAIDGYFKNTNGIDFNVNLTTDNYNLDELLKNNQFGKTSLTINAKGKGKSLNTLDATVNATVNDFKLNNYDIKGLELNGNFNNGKGKITSNYKDKNLNLKLNSTISLDSVNTTANTNINVIGADLQGLGFMQRNVKAGMDISLNFSGNLNNYKIDTDIKNGAIVYDNRTYLLGGLNADAFVDKDTTSVNIQNKTITVNLQSNTDPQSFTNAIKKHIFSYFYRDEVLADTIQNPINLKFKAKISQTPVLEDVFLVNVKDIDTINISVDFNQRKRKLDAKIIAPHINYSGNEIDSLLFTMNTTKDDFNFKLGFKDIKAGFLDVPKTIITGNQKNNELSLNFKGIHKNEDLMNVNAKITGTRDSLIFKVNPDNLLLNKHVWRISDNNKVAFLNQNKLEFTDFKIEKDNQSIAIVNNLPSISKDHIAITYKNFEIQEFFNYLNPEQKVITGVLNGDFILEDPLYNTGIVADISVSKLNFLQTDFGKLSINGKSLGGNKYDFNANIKGGDIDLDLEGDYFVANKEAQLNLDLDINQFKMKALNTLSLGEIKETSGEFSGNFKVGGTTSSPTYNGNLDFKNAQFTITKLNTKFTLENENLKINNTGLFMDNFTVLDAKNNKLILTGTINTESFINPKFNLELTANNFRLLNATKEDNESLYGIATFNANASLTGDLQIPKLSANVTLAPETNVTYVLPATYANVENRDDVVVFVNRENPDAILTQTEEKTATLAGFDIFANLKIDKRAAITVVLNEDTGDNFKVSGDGDFIFNMIPNGRISLSGTYEITDGHYELNLYSLVNRKFYLAPGGRISWSGDPFNAKLDASAIYNIETSAAPLMAAQISDEDPSIRNKYKQVLPFNVYLNIDGELLQPKISFNLDMPEDEQGAIGGQVYGRVQQVNQREEELNKQVFSLLVLNRFYPDSGSDGSLGGFSTIARENLNDAVSGQLNAFSDKILGKSGIELNFDLNSYTDFQGTSATDRTQLGITAEKKLFDERLTVRVGSDVDIQGSNPTGEQTPLFGNVSLEYQLTEDGRYRLKGFRRSEFENVIDGQTIVSGIALIFTQEFNEFSEMWDAIFRGQNEKNKKDKEKAKEKLKKREEEVNKSIEKKKN